MHRETTYDTVFHAQAHFRALLEAFSRPGTIQQLDEVACTPPGRLSRASALVAMALLNADVSFHLLGLPVSDAEYLAINTGARQATLDAATFIFATGAEAATSLDGISCGTLPYPDTAATLVLQVDALSATAIDSGLRIDLSGPGVDGVATVFVRGLSPDLLVALQARNIEFPLGIDALVTATDATSGALQVVGLPRTARLSWQA